jgi:hypothetical protein
MAKVTKEQATDEAKAEQLCMGLAGGIEGAIHGMSELFQQLSEDEDEGGYGMLLVDAANAFNAVNRVAALWNARILWRSCARFLFNTYRGYAYLVVRSTRQQGKGTIMLSREGVTQGDPLSMFLYGIAIMPLIRRCRPPVEGEGWRQCWYADDSSAVARLKALRTWLELLIGEGPKYGYYPEAAKSYLIVAEQHRAKAEEIFEGLPVKIVPGGRFLGGWVGSAETRHTYVKEKAAKWAAATRRLAEIGKRQPQAAFTAFQKSLSAEWAFLKRVVADTDDLFNDVEEAIRTRLLPAIMGLPTMTGEFRQLMALPASDGGIGVPDPSSSEFEVPFATSREASAHLIPAIQTGAPFDLDEHKQTRRAAAATHRANKKERHTGAITALLGSMAPKLKRAVTRIQEYRLSAILTCTPSTVNNTTLAADQFRDYMAIRYVKEPLNLPRRCDGCGATPFTLTHALDCPNGALVNRRHNHVRDVFGDLSKEAFGNAMREPLVEAPLPGRDSIRADLKVEGVWAPMQAALFDVCVTHTDAASYLNRTPAAILQMHAMRKISHNGPACARSHQHFTPLILGTAGEMHEDTQRFMDAIARKLAAKWGKRLSDVKGYVNLHIQLAVARASSMCIRSARETWIGLGAADGAAIPQRD